MTGQTTFLIVSPWYESITIDVGGGKNLTITSIGGDRDSAIYVQSLKVNGESWDKSWLTWEDIFVEGGSMEYVLGDTPVEWSTGELPPSPASGA